MEELLSSLSWGIFPFDVALLNLNMVVFTAIFEELILI